MMQFLDTAVYDCLDFARAFLVFRRQAHIEHFLAEAAHDFKFVGNDTPANGVIVNILGNNDRIRSSMIQEFEQNNDIIISSYE